MQRFTRTVLRIGDWRVDPVSGEIARGEETTRVELRNMRLLECLAEHAGETVSIEQLLNEVWPDVTVSPDSVYQAIATLRRTLGDDPRNPVYIATVPRFGYRLVAPVAPWADDTAEPANLPAGSSAAQAAVPTEIRSRPLYPRILWFACATTLLLIGGFLFRARLLPRQSLNRTPIAQPEKSIAVLPFLDLTEGMQNEEFADGMTEELIDRLSKVTGLHVPSATASFYFKNKRVALGDIARNLGVTYVLDGSVRKSGTRLRVAARLLRAENGYVMWSETYDRPMNDLLMVQDDIAGDVTKALMQSIEGQR